VLRAGLEPATCRLGVDNRNHPARSREVRRGHELRSGRGVEPQRCTSVQPLSPDNRAAPARDDLAWTGLPGVEPGPARLELAVLPFTPQAFESGRPGSNGPPRGGAPVLFRLSYVRVTPPGAARDGRSLRQDSNPHLGRTKGACLPLTLRRQRWRRSESNRHLPRCKRGARPVELHPLVEKREVRTGGLEPPQHEATGLQPAELAIAQRPHEMRWPAGFEPAPTGLTTPGASVYTTTTMKRGRPDSNRRPLA
jgi:hypothetical protein